MNDIQTRIFVHKAHHFRMNSLVIRSDHGINDPDAYTIVAQNVDCLLTFTPNDTYPEPSGLGRTRTTNQNTFDKLSFPDSYDVRDSDVFFLTDGPPGFSLPSNACWMVLGNSLNKIWDPGTASDASSRLNFSRVWCQRISPLPRGVTATP